MSNKTDQQSLQTLWIIFGALCVSMLFYAGVGIAVIEVPENPSDDMVLPIALSFIALTTSVATFFISRFIKGNYTSRCIITWALTESIAIYGLVLYFTTANTIYLGSFILFALAFMAVHAPKKKDFEESQSSES
jgi:hypothetical protein